MRFDYDLAIIGGSPVARYAATQANRLKARVILIEPEWAERSQYAAYYHQALRQALHTVASPLFKGGRGDQAFIEKTDSLTQRWLTLHQWAQTTAEAIVNHEIVEGSLPLLMAAGVDVMIGQGEFISGEAKRRSRGWNRWFDRPVPPVFSIKERRFRSRKYLLAPTSSPILPNLEGYDGLALHTIDSLAQSAWQTASGQALPAHLIILGGDPRSLELAQLFNRLGSQVTLIIGTAHLLPREDPETIALLQAHLEAEGVNVLTQTRVTQVKQIGSQTWVQAGDQALEADAILVVTARHPDLEHLQLPTIGVKWHQWGLPVRRTLQTLHSHLYACGEALGGYPLAHLAQYEAEIAVHNALLWPRASVDYLSVPWAIFTDPPLARVGLTEMEALHYGGGAIHVLRQPLQHLLPSQLHHATTGVCKLIVRRDGRILGAHAVGAEAHEWIGAIALAMQHPIKLNQIRSSTFVSPSFAAILSQFAQQWRQQQLAPWQQDLLESWFSFRRS